MAGLNRSIRKLDLEEYLMAFTKLKCAALVAGAAMLAIGSVPAVAASTKASSSLTQATAGTSDATDFSSQRRRGRYYGGRRGIGPGVAAGALAAGVIGSAIIASQPRRYYYDDGPRYYRGPGYGYGGGYYDGGW